MATRAKRSWNRGSSGQFDRQIGWKFSRTGKLVQAKFSLGSNLKEAKSREVVLRTLWERIENQCTDARPLWDEASLGVAKAIASGRSSMDVPFEDDSESPAAYAARIHRLQRDYPMLMFIAVDGETYDAGVRQNELLAHSFRQNAMNVRVMQEILVRDLTGQPDALRSTGGPTLHEAMREYVGFIEREYFSPEHDRITDWGRTQVRQMEALIRHHPDMILANVGFDAVDDMIGHWRQRPFKIKTKKPVARKSAVNHIAQLKRFFGWLHRRSEFDWRKPEEFGEISTSVVSDIMDRQRKLAQVDTFSLEELTLLNEYATPFERVFLLLGLNCGFGRAEIATLLIDEVRFHSAHAKLHQELLGFETTERDSFIKRVRRKNGVYGEFILFPQTVAGLQWALERRRAQPKFSTEARLLLNENCEPFDKPTKNGNQNGQIPNAFARLLARIRADDNEIRSLSFGKLRKTAGDLIRRLSDGEVMAVFHCRGQAVATDDLADVYSNRPFGKVFAAIRKAQEYLEPVFDAAGPDPFLPGPQAYTSRKTIDTILSEHDRGASPSDIAEKVGRHVSTVHRHIKNRATPGKVKAG